MSLTKRDYYEVLGVGRNADDAAIKRAYRKLAKKYHPDSNAGDKKAAAAFAEVSEAYAVLSDKEKRKLYDQFGHAAFDGSAQAGGAGSAGGANPGGGYQSWHFEGNPEDMDDLFGNIFGKSFRGGQTGGGKHFYRSYTSDGNGNFYEDFGNGSAGGFGGFGSGHFTGHGGAGGFGGFGADDFGGSRKGHDLTTEVEVTFDEAAFGGKKTIHLKGDSGTKSYEVNIPAGIESGKTIRLKGKGMPGAGGAGDLLLKVQVKEKPGFRREGMDLYSTVKIPFATAVLGGEATVQTIYGNVLCKIRPGTQSGSKIRLRGKGIVSMKNPSVHGDQYAVVEIDVPKNVSPEAKEKLRELDELLRGRGTSSAA